VAALHSHVAGTAGSLYSAGVVHAGLLAALILFLSVEESAMRLILLLVLATLALPGRADEFIAVYAEGWIDAVPDTITLSVSAEATGTDVEALQRSVDKTARLVVEAAREQGVEPEDIDTAQLSVRPEYQWRDGQRSYLGQTVRREMAIVLRKIDRFGALMQALSRLDLQELHQPRLSHSNLEELKLRALEQALINGFNKARRIASGIDARLGRVLQVEEQGAAVPQPQPRMMAAEIADAAGSAPEIQFGKQRITAVVTMRFAINSSGETS
jgi:uncharacterized protein YggE